MAEFGKHKHLELGLVINCIKITLATPANHMLIQQPKAITLGCIYILYTCPVERSGHATPFLYRVFAKDAKTRFQTLESAMSSQKTSVKKECSWLSKRRAETLPGRTPGRETGMNPARTVAL